MLMKITTADKIPRLTKEDYAGCVKIYQCLYYDAIGKNPYVLNEPKTRKMFNKILAEYSMAQFVAMIFCHFEWYGPSGRQESDYQYLNSKGFPIELLVKNRNAYASYCASIMGDKWPDEEKLKAVLDIWLKRLMAPVPT